MEIYIYIEVDRAGRDRDRFGRKKLRKNSENWKSEERENVGGEGGRERERRNKVRLVSELKRELKEKQRERFGR